MINLFIMAIRNNEYYKDAHLFLAYSYQKMGKLIEATHEYEIAKSLMTKEEKSAMESYKNILSPNQEKALQNIFNSTPDSLINKRLWNRSDPTFLTTYNEI